MRDCLRDQRHRPVCAARSSATCDCRRTSDRVPPQPETELPPPRPENQRHTVPSAGRGPGCHASPAQSAPVTWRLSKQQAPWLSLSSPRPRRAGEGAWALGEGKRRRGQRQHVLESTGSGWLQGRRSPWTRDIFVTRDDQVPLKAKREASASSSSAQRPFCALPTSEG